jgi:hypothetical protein
MAFMRDPLYILMQDGYVDITTTDGQRTLALEQGTFDAIVMMRYYNMSEEERRAAIKRVLETQFETGADGVRKASGLPTVMERVDMEVERRQTAAYGGSR